MWGVLEWHSERWKQHEAVYRDNIRPEYVPLIKGSLWFARKNALEVISRNSLVMRIDKELK
jgi:isopentenyl phosphate kinase